MTIATIDSNTGASDTSTVTNVASLMGSSPTSPTSTSDLQGLQGATTTDATAIIDQTLAQYGLSNLSNWAWNEITNGSSPTQVMVDLYATPQFAQRFPGIIQRQQAGLPAISPADYVSYEDSAKQLENQYALPSGFLDNPDKIGNWIGSDVSMTELTDRVQNGYSVVASAPPEVRQAYTAMFGANGDGALASQFLDESTATPLLLQQATAAQLSGEASKGGINMDKGTAMELAQGGATASSLGSTISDLQKESPLFNANINEQNNVTIGQQGIEAAAGLSGNSAQEIIQRQQAREANFQGGGAAASDQFGAEGVGAARPL